jgi:hypothetical protein
LGAQGGDGSRGIGCQLRRHGVRGLLQQGIVCSEFAVLVARPHNRPLAPNAGSHASEAVTPGELRERGRRCDLITAKQGVMPAKGGTHPSRVHVVGIGSAHWRQMLLVTDAESATWVTATAAEED